MSSPPPDERARRAIAGLSPEQQLSLLRDLERSYGGERPDAFIRRIFPHHPPPRHVLPICDVIDNARRRRKRVCISMPPGHAKSLTVLRCIAWWLTRNPHDMCAYASHNDHFSWQQSRKARRFAQMAGLVVGDESKTKDMSNTVSEWHTRDGGGLIAGGAGSGALIGRRVHGLLVVDDPYSNREDDESQAKRSKVLDWFFEVAYTRMEGASILVVHTRWTEDDLIGQLHERAGWEFIRMPAIAEDGEDPLGREVGEALWPDVHPLEELLAIKSEQGEWRFACSYQQRPQPRGARVFGEPCWYDPDRTPLLGAKVWIAADPAASEKKKADHSAAVCLATLGSGPSRVGYVLDVMRGQWTVPEFVRQLRAFQLAHYGAPVAVESVGGFKAVPQILRELDPNLRIVEVQPSVDKFQRAQGVAAAWNEGRVLLPMPSGKPSPDWIGPFVKEVTKFSGTEGMPDDQVDALAHAWNVGATEPGKIRSLSSNLLSR